MTNTKGPRSNFDRLPNDMREQIVKLLNLPSKAKFSTAFGVRIPDPDNIRELGDIVYASAMLLYAFTAAEGPENVRTQTKRVMGKKNFERFRVTFRFDERGDAYVLLRGNRWQAFLPRGTETFIVLNAEGTRFVFSLNGQRGWSVSRVGRSVNAKSVIKRQLQRAHMARPRNAIDNNNNFNRMFNITANRPLTRPYPRTPARVSWVSFAPRR